MVITVILDAALERTLDVPGLTLGESCRAEHTQLQPGGQGLTAAMALHNLGGRGAVVGVVGGAEGEYIRDRLDAMGLPNDLVLGRAGTPINLRLTDGNRVTRIREHAPEVSEQELQEVWQKVSDQTRAGDVVLIAGELPQAMTPELLAQWVGCLRSEGVRTVLNIEGGRQYAAVKPSLLIAGPAEMSSRYGVPPKDQTALARAAEQASNDGIEGVVIPLEDGSVLFARADETLRVQGSGPIADEALTAGILTGLSLGEDWRTLAVRAAGAENVTACKR